MNKPLSYLASIMIFVGFGILVAWRQSGSFTPSAIDAYRGLILKGFINTIIVSVIALTGSVILGFVMFLLSATKVRFFRAFVDVFTEIIYGTPLLVMIIVMAFLIGPAFNTYNRAVMGVTGIIIYITPQPSHRDSDF